MCLILLQCLHFSKNQSLAVWHKKNTKKEQNKLITYDNIVEYSVILSQV